MEVYGTKIRASIHQKKITHRVRMQARDWEITTTHTTGKELVSRISKQLLQINRNRQLHFLNGQKRHEQAFQR